jgi:class 3 adenylate cyclase/peptidoglycan hydrolase-like protein with peptidoglycan-binding domain
MRRKNSEQMSTLETDPKRKAERHLAAILAADVVGYSSQMERDEVGTLHRLSDLRHNLIEPKIAEHRGRIFKTMGDGFLAEFVSVLEALHCAVDIQRLMTARNLDLPEDDRLLLRMGINLGDVFHEGEDVFGDGVNIAARLEGIAPPGGIYVSRAACDSVRERLAFDFEDLGEHRVKNISRPIHVFGVRIGEGLEHTQAPASAGSLGAAGIRTVSSRRAAVLALAGIAALGAVFFLGFWVWDRLPQDKPQTEQATLAPHAPQQPTEPTGPPIAPQPKTNPDDLAFWQAISSSSNASDFEEYLHRFPDGQFAVLAHNRLDGIEAAARAAAQVPPVQPISPQGSSLTLARQQEVQRALRVLGHYQGEADGGFGAGTEAAIKQFQLFAGLPETGMLADNERERLLDMARRLLALLDQPSHGTAASSVKGGDARYARALNLETGKGVKPDLAEAAYWYALAAGDGQARAFTNLGTLVARGWGATKPDPINAAVLWWAAAARDEPTAMYDLGVLYERGVGVAANLDYAKDWYRRAAALNDPEARSALKRLGV